MAVANEESSNTQGTAADEPNDVDGSQEQSAESQVDIDWVRSSA